MESCGLNVCKKVNSGSYSEFMHCQGHGGA